ncbi:type II secretion system F family protein [Paenarthrobacter sp. NPDC089675]|uniref:type II secretion system F family protein n=1 Tax=Paenarthrobacter sp. NPDC089675 TaxID=3364376 RepID=UPI0037F3A5FA
MGPLLGALCGTGFFLVWWSTWDEPQRERDKQRGPGRLELLLLAAGIEKVSGLGLLLCCGGVGLFVVLASFVVTGSLPVAGCFGLLASWLPAAIVRRRAKKRRTALRSVWPEVVDHLRSGIRAGLSLPDALIQLGYKGPAELRHAFLDFASDYRSGGRFDTALTNLKGRLADPVADRIIEALRMTREVGGSDLGRMLGTLAAFLRETSRTRGELEARQSWTVNGARLAVAAPWIVLAVMSGRPEAMMAYSSATGAAVLLGGLGVSGACYAVMLRIGALPEDQRVLR